MDLHEKIRTLPTRPGVYLYKNAEDEVIYVGKAKNLRSRVRSYLLEASQANAKTGSLMREAVDVDYILVDNEHEALALENNLIKQRKPRFNILLRDDKTYPYVKLTLGDRYPKVFVTRRLRKDGGMVDLRIDASRMTDSTGAMAGWVYVCHQNGDDEAVRHYMAERARVVRRLGDVVADINAELELEAVLDRIAAARDRAADRAGLDAPPLDAHIHLGRGGDQEFAVAEID